MLELTLSLLMTSGVEHIERRKTFLGHGQWHLTCNKNEQYIRSITLLSVHELQHVRLFYQ